MTAQIFSFFERPGARARDWSQQELAEFYRVESALLQASVQLQTDRGVSDEGDPWFVFCRSDSGDVFLHFALIDGLYVVDGAAFEQPERGADFAALIKDLIGRYPLAQARERAASNVFVHPAALLIALVGAVYFHSSDAKAAETHATAKPETRRASLIVTSAAPAPAEVAAMDRMSSESSAEQAAAVILSAVLTLSEDLFATTHDMDALAAARLDLALRLPHAAVAIAPQDLASVAASHAAAATAAAPIAPFVDLHALAAAVAFAPAAAAPAVAERPANTVPLTVVHADQAPGLPTPVAPPSALTHASGDGDKPIFLARVLLVAPTEAVAAANAASNADGLGSVVGRAAPNVDALPANLLDLINRGEHHTTAPPEIGTPAAGAPAPDLGAPVGGGGTVHIGPGALNAVIDAAIAAFLAMVPHLDVISQGNQLILFDHDVFNPLAPSLNLASVTYTFEDGSSVSLVGTVDELSHSLGG